MEKRKPTFALGSFKSDFATGHAEITVSARRDAFAIGYLAEDMKSAIAAMERTHFVKSMTSFSDQRVWQDVYNVPHEGLTLYIKITNGMVTEFRLLSFKEK